MALKKYTCPPQGPAGSSTFSDDLVGFQLVTGGGLTQGNFEFATSFNEKTNRKFSTGTFSNPISLEGLGLESTLQSRTIFENNFKVYPNFDLSQITNFTQYGSLVKRLSTAVETIIAKFPAALEATLMGENYIKGETATNITYDEIDDITSFDLDVARLRNPFAIDFTINSTRNLELKEIQVSSLRDMTVQYANYSLYYNGNGYNVTAIIPTTSMTSGTLNISVSGHPFPFQTVTFDDLVIRPNDYEVNRIFNEHLDEVENFLLNRNVTPKYTASFNVPRESEDGTYFSSQEFITFPLNGSWNLDIVTNAFTNYLVQLNDIGVTMDEYKTNIVARFLTTGAFQEFDTIGQKMEKVLQIYGRSFDETNKFISALAFMNSVHYNPGDDIPSQLLKNLAQTLGWQTNMSPVSTDDFLSSVFGQTNTDRSQYPGISDATTPDELNYQYYRNLILNSAYLFKSKGTRKSIETLMALIGAPDALVEFNEYIYLADQRINVNQFNTQFAQISGGTYTQELPTLEAGNTYRLRNVEYTGFTTTTVIKDVNITKDEYPMDDLGFPKAPPNTEDFFFEKGSGWFEQTPKHRAPEEVSFTNSVFTGANPNYQTVLTPYTYGQEYFNRFRDFPFMNLGYNLTQTTDNNKSWVDTEVGLRSNLEGGYNARYFTTNDALVLNAKNVDLFLNPAQGLSYDVWTMSREYNFPIPNEGLNYVQPTYCDPNPVSNYPMRGGVDWTEINPQPKRKTFFEFAQTFWKNMINVRNRQFSTDGKTMGYPTLESIYWKYLDAQNLAGVPDGSFNYTNMIEYVDGMGDYWVRLVEQMVPASTIWNTGVKYENSIFHRQKFVWRRQEGCQLIPVPCNPCSMTSNLYTYDCYVQSVQCSIYPWQTNPRLQSFSAVLGYLLTNYLEPQGYELNDCQLNTLKSTWYVVLSLDDVNLVQQEFFMGTGYTNTGLSSPTTAQWDAALIPALNSLDFYGFEYILNDTDVIIYSSICSVNDSGINFKLNVGINFEILCN